MQRTALVACLFLAGSTPGASAQDLAAGETSFKKCLPCHSVGPDAKNKVGPVLNGLDGRHSGSIEGYNYTEANKNSGLTWDEDTLRKYLANPQGTLKGTKMIFAGIKDPEKANDVIAYLKQFKEDGSKAN